MCVCVCLCVCVLELYSCLGKFIFINLLGFKNVTVPKKKSKILYTVHKLNKN